MLNEKTTKCLTAIGHTMDRLIATRMDLDCDIELLSHQIENLGEIIKGAANDHATRSRKRVEKAKGSSKGTAKRP